MYFTEAQLYLCELIQSYNLSRRLSLSSGNRLVVPCTVSEVTDRGLQNAAHLYRTLCLNM